MFYCLVVTHFVYSLFHWWTLSCFHLLAIMDNAAMNILLQVFVLMCFEFSCLCLGVKLLDHMFNIWVTDKLFYRDTALFFIPTNHGRGFLLLCIVVRTVYCLFLIVTILAGVKWYLGLIYISPVSNDVNPFVYPFVYLRYFSICIFHLEKCLFKSLAHL